MIKVWKQTYHHLLPVNVKTTHTDLNHWTLTYFLNDSVVMGLYKVGQIEQALNNESNSYIVWHASR